MLTGRPLFEGSLTRVVTQHIMQAPPLEKLSWLPTPVAELLDSMLAKTPEQRPRSCRDLRSRIQRCVDELDAGSTLPAVPNDRTVAAIHPPSSVPGSYAAPAVSAHPSAVPAAATMPTRVPPQVAPPGPPPLPAPAAKTPEPEPAKKHRPTAQPVLIIGAVFALLAVLVIAGLVLVPVLKRMATSTKINTPVSTPAPASTPVPIADRDFKEAFRDTRDAQRAAEELSMTMMRFDANRELIALATKTGNSDGLKVYSRAEQALEITRLDAENAFLISAKRLNAYPSEVTDKAYGDIEEEVSKAGVGWRTRVAQMLPKYVSKVTPEMVRVDPGFLDELKALQPKP
jgi:hypothetical protein